MSIKDETTHESSSEDHLSFTNWDWDTKTINEVAGLIKWLDENDFLYYLDFFHRVMPHADELYAILQKCNVSIDTVASAVGQFKKTVSKVREEIDSTEVASSSPEEPPAK